MKRTTDGAFSVNKAAQGPCQLGQRCHGWETCRCDMGIWHYVLHPSGGNSMSRVLSSSLPSAPCFVRAYVASRIALRSSAEFPNRLVRGSASMTLPGTQNVTTWRVLAEMQITATSIWARRHWPAFPLLLLRRSNNAFASVTWTPWSSSKMRTLFTSSFGSRSSGFRITSTDCSLPSLDPSKTDVLGSKISCQRALIHSISAKASSMAKASLPKVALTTRLSLWDRQLLMLIFAFSPFMMCFSANAIK